MHQWEKIPPFHADRHLAESGSSETASAFAASLSGTRGVAWPFSACHPTTSSGE